MISKLLDKHPYVRGLHDKILTLDAQLFEATEFEKIASGKLTVWVGKHDELLIKYKALVTRFKKLHPRAKI